MPKTPAKSNRGIPQTKGDKIIGLLQRKTSASITDLAKATGLQLHSTHGFMSGTLKKKCDISITSRKEQNKDRRYFIVEHTQ